MLFRAIKKALEIMFLVWRYRGDVVAGRRLDVPRSLSKLKDCMEQPGIRAKNEVGEVEVFKKDEFVELRL